METRLIPLGVFLLGSLGSVRSDRSISGVVVVEGALPEGVEVKVGEVLVVLNLSALAAVMAAVLDGGWWDVFRVDNQVPRGCFESLVLLEESWVLGGREDKSSSES